MLKPLRNTLASGKWSENVYDPARRVSSATDSDGNVVQYAYDAFGRLSAVSDSDGRSETFLRDLRGAVTNETQTLFDSTFQTNRTATFDRTYDALGRPVRSDLKIDGVPARRLCYDYDMHGHLSRLSVTNAQGRGLTFVFTNRWGRSLGYSVQTSAGSFACDRATAVSNRFDGAALIGFTYAYDDMGRPISRDADAFGYDVRGEVTNATISAISYVYAYDEIGNRTAATAGAAALAYAANALNEYTAATGETPSDDADGNLLRRGDKNLMWDARGRFSKASPDLVARWQNWWEYEYDRQGRRTAKRRMVFMGGWAPPDEIDYYFYDGRNLAHQIHIDAFYQVTHIDYFWGPDLSGSLQGAGGVGGLVAVSIRGDFYFPGYDNNGNVVGYWDESGSLVAEYAYDAFGNTISSSGSMASVFPHRFSTKYYDAETDLDYYGYRYYYSSLGRWISRDPIQEDSSPNLFLFCCNAPSFVLIRSATSR